MKIILNSDVERLGRKGEVVSVKDGYARNFLIPRNLAIRATKGALKQAEDMSRSRAVQEQQEKASALELAEKIKSTPLKITAKAGEEGHLFGSVTTAEIADALGSVLGVEIDRRKLEIAEPIRSLGTHQFAVHLHSEVNAEGTLEVIAELG